MTVAITTIARMLAEGKPLVRVSVIRAEGSAPREVGATMLVTREETYDTIGGGRLELEVIGAARAMLTDAMAASEPWPREVRHYPLGPALGQCCGGHVGVLLEGFGAFERPLIAGLAKTAGAQPHRAILMRELASGTPPVLLTGRKDAPEVPLAALRTARAMLSDTREPTTLVIKAERSAPGWVLEPLSRPRSILYLYGAGHVGRSVVRALADLPFDVTWIDVETSRYPQPVPDGVRALVTPLPDRAAALAPPAAMHLVMTFSHALDLAICHAILHKGEFGYLGLIGSRTKRMRFVRRLQEAGIGTPAIARLHCPIGLPGIPGKEPAMIAVAVAADLLQRAAGMENATDGRLRVERS